MLLSQKRLRRLAWDELDHLLVGQSARRQKDLVGFRRLGTQINNMFPGPQGAIRDEQYLHLPEVDGPQGPGLSAEALAELKKTRDRLAAQNAQRLAEKAAQTS